MTIQKLPVSKLKLGKTEKVSKSESKSSLDMKDFDVTTQETVEMHAPSLRQKIIITITKRHYYDPMKNKVVTDQVLHKARYSLAKKKSEKKEEQ